MQTPTLRSATLDDVDFLCHVLYRIHLQERPESSPEPEPESTWTEDLRAAHTHDLQGNVEGSTLYVIELGADKIGRLRLVRSPGRLELAGIQLLPTHQGQGLGTAVITTVLQEAATHAVPVELRVNKSNPHAHRLYTRLGFQLQSEDPVDYQMTRFPSSPPAV